ncbi:hypothetical protein Tsubulata_012155 [Turnera subulata]|uniref:IBH1-like N-terminal domain-containing protein n=1 Tax=Turnera subulata TaxID=218843 RepID=A0A9Q0JN75_9ROSI|nr:hypothetical protein Tsubulata_012155 [Turnera subulata]
MSPQRLSLNPRSLKSRFTKGFLRSLRKIHKERPTSTSPREIFQRYRKVKTAADKSLASAVGSGRAWSRAMLCKCKNQGKRRPVLVRRINNNRAMKRSELTEKKSGDDDEEVGFDQASGLRKLVPGGQAMDLCRLLEEAAHYIKCLNTQVQVMRCIADCYTT